MRYLFGLLLLAGAIWFLANDNHILAKTDVPPYVADEQAEPPLSVRKPTSTRTPTATPTSTSTATATVLAPTTTNTPTATATASNTPTSTATATATSTATATATATVLAPTTTNTPTATSTASNTPTSTATATATVPAPTATNTPTATAIATSTSTPTRTATATALAPTATNTPTATATATSTSTPTRTATATALTLTPTNTPTATGIPGNPVYPLKASLTGRYLVDQNNVPFLIQGDSPQGLMALSPTDQDLYLSSRHNAGLNTVWVSLLCTTYSSICPDVNAYGAIPPFTKANDLSTPNEAYFAQVDAMLNRAASYGMLVVLGPIETGYWLPVLRTNGTTKSYNYGVYLGNRYKNYPNIIWMSGNDFQTWTTPSDDAVVKAVADGIKSVDINHIQTVELNYDASGSLDDPNWTSLIKLDTAYSYYPQYDQMLREYNRSTVPVWFVEGVYEFQGYQGGYLGPYTLRNQEYWTNLSGSTGQLYGNADLFGFPPGWKNTNWQATIGFTQSVIANRFFLSYPWFNLVPDQNHILVTAGYGTYSTCCLNANSNYATTAATADGKLVIAYLPTLRTITVDMSKLSGPVTARWFDPTNGVYTSIGTFANTGTRQFTPPGNNSGGDGDWVLVLQGS